MVAMEEKREEEEGPYFALHYSGLVIMVSFYIRIQYHLSSAWHK